MIKYKLTKVFYIEDFPEYMQIKIEKELSEDFDRSLNYLEYLVVDTELNDLEIYNYFISIGIKEEEYIIIQGLN